MKAKHLLLALTAPALIIACTNDELLTDNMGNTLKGDLVNADDLNFVVNRGTNTNTRAIWDQVIEGTNVSYRFFWENEKDADVDAIGLAYVGSATGTEGVTNYKFSVDSLLLKSFIPAAGQPRVTGYYQTAEVLDAIKTVYGDEIVEADLKTSTSAKFKTVNDQIMKGYYVAYYPFNAGFQDPGSIIVKSPKRIDLTKDGITAAADISKANLKEVGESSFAYSKPAKLEPGAQVTYLDMQSLSSLIRLEITNKQVAAINLRTVILRTRGGDLFTVNGTLMNPAADPSASNIKIAEKDGTSATLTVGYPYVKGDESKTAYLGVPTYTTDTDKKDVFFPLLPATFNGGFDVILINENGMACVIEKDFKNSSVTFESGKASLLAVTIETTTKFDQSFVTTAGELNEAIVGAKTLDSANTINLLGDVESSNFNMTDASTGWKKGVTIAASAGSKLILNNPTITLFYGKTAADDATLTINAPVTINGGMIKGNVVLGGESIITGEVSIGEAVGENNFYPGKLTINGTATVKDALLTARYAKGTTIGKNGKLIIAEGAEFINGNWKFDDLGDKQYKSDLFIDGTFEVETGATFYDGGDTEIHNGGKLLINGVATKRNTLNCVGGTIVVNGIWTNELADNAANTLANAGNIKIVTGNLNLNNGGKLYNKASLNCMGTFANNGTFYDYVGSVYGGKPYTSNGIYACYVNSQTRLAEAVSRLNMYAATKYQMIVLQKLEDGASYDLKNIAVADARKLNISNEGDVTINNTNATDKTATINSLTAAEATLTISSDVNMVGATIGGRVVSPIEILKNSKMIFNNNIKVMANGAIANVGTFDLLPAEAGKLPANVFCISTDVTKGKWTNYPIVDETGSFWK